MTVTLPDRPPATPGPPRRRRGARWWLVALVVLLAAVAVPTASYLRALTYPGDAPVSVRTVEWIRDHGGAGLVNVLENWWYSRAPSTAAPDPGSLPPPPPLRPAAVAGPAPIAVLPGLTPLPGEGQWSVRRVGPAGAPLLLTTFVRPDARHASVVAGLARIDPRATRLQLVAGTTQPDHRTWPEHAQVPAAQRNALVATFNSGFKMSDSRGGFLADGRTAVPLRTGAASVVVSSDGSATVGVWGRDAGPGPDVVAVRQNLDLVVDAGRVVDGIGANTDGRWGPSKIQLQYTWRSGLGVDAAGNLVYVAGAGLNLSSLAAALVQAGAVRGMQLDIHNEMVDFFVYPHPGAASGVKLLPDMPGSTGRYLAPDQRDFFAVTLR